MKSSIFLSLFTASFLMAGNLVVTQGSVTAHTEVFGDSKIDPQTTGLTSHLSMQKSIESIKGSIDISIKKLKSTNTHRDENMIEAIESDKYPLATFTFKKVKKIAKGYTVHELLNFHGVEKPLTIQADISQNGAGVTFKGNASFLMSNYKVTPPKMFFLTVRDQIDLEINVHLKKGSHH